MAGQFAAEDGVHLIDPANGAETGALRDENLSPRSVQWSHDGRRLAVCGVAGELRIFSGEGYQQVSVAELDGDCGDARALDLRREAPVAYFNEGPALRRQEAGGEEGFALHGGG